MLSLHRSSRVAYRRSFQSLHHVSRASRIAFSCSASRYGYEDTIQNLKIGKHTRVIFQGFTGKQATQNAKQSIEWGTKIVGGVRPGKSGEHLGLPVLPTVRVAMEQLKPDATGIYVAAHQAAGAIEEAIEAEIPLIVAVAEHVPLHDILRIHSMLNTQSKSRLVGANAPGIISAIGRCRIGFQPLPTFSPGHVGVVAKSGTLSYETVASLTRAGLGQSLCIGMGGDVIAGTNFVDALKVFEHDEDTEGIILVGEVGGRAEEEAAEWIRDYRGRTAQPKPIAAVVGGRCARPGAVMGHAGAWAAPGEASAETKHRILEDAGVTMVDHPEKFGGVMKELLAKSGRNVQKIEKSAANQRRGYHTQRRMPSAGFPYRSTTSIASLGTQRRGLFLSATQAADMLSEHGIKISPSTESAVDSHLLSITIDRQSRSPCILASPTTAPSQNHRRAKRFPFDYRQGPSQSTLQDALAHLQLDAAPPVAKATAMKLMQTLWSIYKEKEALTLTVHLAVDTESDSLRISNPSFHFDDAAFRSNNRQAELHALRDLSREDPTEVEAERDGIVYVKLPTASPGSGAASGGDGKGGGGAEVEYESYNIGTLVNGAGLAMNTVDALATHNGLASNFLDTGGKATSETVKRSFELVLRDERVKVVFVNIFGGLTLCDMIAEGVLKAFKELEIKVPVVVRLRGTNEEEGQRIIADSGLPLYAYDGFEEAAKKVVELAREAEMAERGKSDV
ncbi:hypothetical protein W97_00240 [Coniosporium apollinis CBS 100218]|uniref:CoA-binding domain-containing protein n=1 Tax=Coniosporium apollinis (strain CBS 100218) TaxID=1168221 RepID=R7YGL4_CONA1|nr:uncharacterized protein W97_00240 [Coniosporium apollinis CBS 100218]EON61030.1 hypothetical protein W97_00240 [Coniosporium apollinis CBS 100218]